MDLIDQIRTTREVDRLTPVSQSALTDISQLGTSVDPHRAIAVNSYEGRLAALLQEATNFDLIRTYQHDSGALTGSEIDVLAIELRRRGVKL